MSNPSFHAHRRRYAAFHSLATDVESIHHAVMILGDKWVRTWSNLVILSGISDKPKESLTARDLMIEVPEPLTPDDDLARAAHILAEHPADEISVVRDRREREVIGTFSRRDLIVAYGRQLQKIHGRVMVERRAEARLRARPRRWAWWRRGGRGPA